MSALARTCGRCGAKFTVRYASDRKQFCGYSCSAKARPARIGAANSNWRGGRRDHPLYEIYSDMLARCTRPGHARWSSYGGRGIGVCERWRNDFWAFVADVGERPAGRGGRASWSLDRIDNAGDYEPTNVRWATDSQQMKNRRPAAYAGTVRDEITGRFLPAEEVPA